MPELPEVETIANDLRHQNIIGTTIENVFVYWDKTVLKQSPSDFIKALIGKKIVEIGRRAKYLLIHLDSKDIITIHLRMTGRLTLKPCDSPPLLHEHLILHLSSGFQLHYHDTRKFGRWHLIKEGVPLLPLLGPEPLADDFPIKKFKEKLKRTQRLIKPVLLDQTIIAGIGNIYADEALWESKIHPQTKASDLSDKQINLLVKAIKIVLARGLSTKGTTLGSGKNNYYRLDGSKGDHQLVLNVFRRTGKPCPRCSTLISKIVVAQRSTHLCYQCQPLKSNSLKK